MLFGLSPYFSSFVGWLPALVVGSWDGFSGSGFPNGSTVSVTHHLSKPILSCFYIAYCVVVLAGLFFTLNVFWGKQLSLTSGCSGTVESLELLCPTPCKMHVGW